MANFRFLIESFVFSDLRFVLGGQPDAKAVA